MSVYELSIENSQQIEKWKYFAASKIPDFLLQNNGSTKYFWWKALHISLTTKLCLMLQDVKHVQQHVQAFIHTSA